MGYWAELGSWLLKDLGKILRCVVLFVCCIVVIVQLSECFSKLANPPISTHSYYSLNETIDMPAVTICREPPYKEAVLSNISGDVCSHPKYNTCWAAFPFDQVDLGEFFMNGTFKENETFLHTQYGLNGLTTNVEVSSSLHFFMGLCHTIRPKIPIRRALKNSGYSMMLTHHIQTVSQDSNILFEAEPGWHIFIHDMKEDFTEINMNASGRVEYVFAQVNEEIEIKLHSQYFFNVDSKQQPCCSSTTYSDLKCSEACIWQKLSEKANCSGPWMSSTSITQSHCNTYKTMRNLIASYARTYNGDEVVSCNCKAPCETRIYTAYIQNRKPFYQPFPSTQIWIYYTTKLISIIEERPSYDTTQFIADIGGSLGFLLGLSVLGFINLLEHVLTTFSASMNKQKRHPSYSHTDSTVDIATISNFKSPL